MDYCAPWDCVNIKPWVWVFKREGGGFGVYHGFVVLIEVLRSWGFTMCFASASPCYEADFLGYISQAFYHSGFKVMAVQHGGSYGLFRRPDNLGHDFSDYMYAHLGAGEFLSWGGEGRFK